jgi:hypothetical protein
MAGAMLPEETVVVCGEVDIAGVFAGCALGGNMTTPPQCLQSLVIRGDRAPTVQANPCLSWRPEAVLARQRARTQPPSC